MSVAGERCCWRGGSCFNFLTLIYYIFPIFPLAQHHCSESKNNQFHRSWMLLFFSVSLKNVINTHGAGLQYDCNMVMLTEIFSFLSLLLLRNTTVLLWKNVNKIVDSQNAKNAKIVGLGWRWIVSHRREFTLFFVKLSYWKDCAAPVNSFFPVMCGLQTQRVGRLCNLSESCLFSDVCPPGMRTFVGSVLMSGNILSWRLVMK